MSVLSSAVSQCRNYIRQHTVSCRNLNVLLFSNVFYPGSYSPQFILLLTVHINIELIYSQLHFELSVV